MQTLKTRHIASITELREPMKVLEAANGEPVAILKNNKHIATLTPISEDTASPQYIGKSEILEMLEKRRTKDQPVLTYLQNR